MVKLYLDPGHGGSDPGAVGNGLREKDLTLSIATYARNYLEEYYPSISIRMSRTNDITKSLTQRTNEANSWGADAFVSIHINAGGGTGFESFVYYGVSASTKRLQDFIHQEVIAALDGFRDRGQKHANYHVLRESNMSSCLTENLFIDTRADADYLSKNSNLRNLGEAHARGIAKFFGLDKKEVFSIATSSPPASTDNDRWRIQTGLFDDAESYANAIRQLKSRYSWLIHEKATTTELNPRYRIVTGLFTGKNVAEYYAEQVRKEFGWNVHVVER